MPGPTQRQRQVCRRANRELEDGNADARTARAADRVQDAATKEARIDVTLTTYGCSRFIVVAPMCSSSPQTNACLSNGRSQRTTNIRSSQPVERTDVAEQMFDLTGEHHTVAAWPTPPHLPPTRDPRRDRAPPAGPRLPASVREIGEAVGLTSPSTVHNHLATLQRLGYLRRDPTKPRAIEVRFDPSSGRRWSVARAGDPARRRCRRRRQRPRSRERRGALPAPGRLHRRRRAVHVAGAGRLDGRCGNP